MTEISEYEKIREANIQIKTQKLKELGLKKNKTKKQEQSKLELSEEDINKPRVPRKPRVNYSEPDFLSPILYKKRIRINTKGKEISYNDDYLFCEICNEYTLDGCFVHPVRFLEGSDIAGVYDSTIKNAGKGVFNDSQIDIPINTIFGPYGGSKVDIPTYKSKPESGYAWEILDTNFKSTIGYVDPGPNPHPIKNWMAFVNSAIYAREQNLHAIQFRGSIYYQVVSPIKPNKEFLTYYGDEYAKGIDIQPYNYYKHDRIIHEIKESDNKGFKCDICFKTFSFKHNLNRHINSIHLKIKKYCCEICGKIFNHNINKQTHIINIHQKKKYPCNYCPKIFSTDSQLSIHINKTHTFQKLYKCTICGFSTFSHNAFFYHKKSKHTHDKYSYHKCNYCDKSFILKTDLKIHIDGVHLKIRYPCHKCNASYTRQQKLNTHFKKKHSF